MKTTGTIKNYWNFHLKQKKEAFEKYWTLVRNDELLIQKKNLEKSFLKILKIRN